MLSRENLCIIILFITDLRYMHFKVLDRIIYYPSICLRIYGLSVTLFLISYNIKVIKFHKNLTCKKIGI